MKRNRNSHALASALIRCPSVTPLEAGTLSLLEEELNAAGFVCLRQSFSENNPSLSQNDTQPVENLYARFGTSAPNLCFAGHVDVVPPGDEAAWKYPPFAAETHDGVLYGRGAEDMKAAIAAFVCAACDFVEKPFKGSISFLITCDEEGIAINGTRKMLEWLKERGEVLDACIVGEPTNPTTLGEMMKIGRRGSANGILTVTGVQGHVAYPHLAENPVTRLVEMLHALKNAPLDKGTEFFQPSNLEVTSVDVGNPSVNVIPEKATARFNIRFNDTYNEKSIEAWVRAQLYKVGGAYNLALRVSGEAFLTPPGPLSECLTRAVKDVTGLTAELSTTGGTSDARFIKNYCPVVEFGTTGKTPHKVNECVRVEDIEALERIYGRVLELYFSG